MNAEIPDYLAPLVEYVDHEKSYTRMPDAADVVRLVMRDLRAAQADANRLARELSDARREIGNWQMGATYE